VNTFEQAYSRDGFGGFKTRTKLRHRILRHIDSRPRTWAYIASVLALGFVQHVLSVVI
jgi:alkylhydroperoxidase/carboxymuconolactone decarboxylase family protein YurZ